MMQDGAEADRTGTWQGEAEPRVRAPFALPERWRLQRMLGQGGQAEVWLAEDTALGQLVAVKVFPADLTGVQRERIRREVRLGRDVEHPRLVRVFELLDLGGRPAAVMEYLSGGSIAQQLQQDGPLPVARVVAIAEDVLGVLAALHERGIVHRDVKPSNLLLDAGGNVHLADLGLALPLDADARLTRTATSVGTPSYMSPEQLRGADPAPAADLYSLGCTVFQLLTGRLPFEGGTEFEVAEAHLHRLPPDPRRLRPECPHWLAAFVLRLLEKRPAARWPDAAAAARALARRRWLTTPRFRRRLGAAAAAVVVGATLVFLVLQRRPVPAQVTVGGDTVTVTDRTGRTLWTVRSAGRVDSACVADFYGEGRPQVAIGETAPTAIPDRKAGRILIYGADGRERLVLHLENRAQEDYFPDLNPTTGAVTLLAADLDGDGIDELAYFTEHVPWYPSQIGVWLPRSGIRPRELLVNSGRVVELKAADLDGDGANELLATGTNNPLGYQPFIAIVWRFSRGQPKYSAPGTASPDHLALYARPDDPVSKEFPYTVLGVGSQPTIVSAGPDGIEVELRTTRRRVRLDPDANPAGSPLFGRGTAPRTEHWRGIAEACIALEGHKISGEEAIARVLARWPQRVVRTPAAPQGQRAVVALGTLEQPSCRTECAGECLRRPLLRVHAQHLSPRPKGWGTTNLPAVAGGHLPSVPRRDPAYLFEQTRLADSGIAGHQEAGPGAVLCTA